MYINSSSWYSSPYNLRVENQVYFTVQHIFLCLDWMRIVRTRVPPVPSWTRMMSRRFAIRLLIHPDNRWNGSGHPRIQPWTHRRQAEISELGAESIPIRPHRSIKPLPGSLQQVPVCNHGRWDVFQLYLSDDRFERKPPLNWNLFAPPSAEYRLLQCPKPWLQWNTNWCYPWPKFSLLSQIYRIKYFVAVWNKIFKWYLKEPNPMTVPINCKW